MLGKCQVLLCDGDESVKDGFCAFSNRSDEIDWARNVVDACSMFVDKVYDLLVLEIDLPGRSGLELIETACSSGVTSLVFSRFAEELLGVQSLRYGASGYVEKRNSLSVLSDAICRLDSGGKWVSSELAALVARSIDQPIWPHEKLSPREFSVFMEIMRGRTIAEIAIGFSVAETTIRSYVGRIKDKMGISRVWEIWSYASKTGLV